MAHCFWCLRNLKDREETRDHFMSRPLWKSLVNKELTNRGYSCISCERCNTARGAITSLFVQVKRMNRKFNAKTCSSLLRCRGKHIQSILKFRKKIEEGLINPKVKTLCLHELDEVLTFGFDQETIRVRAYHMWEKAGRPSNRHDEFWFLAEKQLIAECKVSYATL